MPNIETFKELRRCAIRTLKEKGFATKVEYIKRLDFELIEINKQGANRYWLRNYNEGKKWEHNKNGLIFPFLLGMTPIDPISFGTKHKIEYHPDFPDIDIDFLPHARDPVKKYAEEKYGSQYVCSVGLWLRYHPKLALQDAAAALGKNRYEVIAMAKTLPDEFDTMTFEQSVGEFSNFAEFAKDNPEVCELAYKMVGKIKAQGRHAGGLIISSVPIKDYIPLTLCGIEGKKQWTSAWIEGMADTQLSKFGLIKFDILGLRNLSYIWNCCRLIKKSKNSDIKFEDLDPRDDRAGWIYFKNGKKKKKIRFNDPKVLKAADDLRLNSIFQFDTDFQQSIVKKGGVKSFMDLVIYTSLGRPGPLPMIDVYIDNRDNKEAEWKKELHPIMLNILDETKGVLTFQEQLLRTWTELCGFTMPEAEAAQKAVKKKKVEILEEIGPMVIKGAALNLGQEKAKKLWDNMISFGRYCFNKAHAVAYIVIAYRCLWLKTHFPAEWWAAVLSECPATKFNKFIGAARSEGIKFGSIDVRRLSTNYTVGDDEIMPGLTSIKGIGQSMAKQLITEADIEPFNIIEDIVNRCGKNKTALERLIKLGGFDHINVNRKLLWLWYRYKYDNGKDVTKFRKLVNACYIWDIEVVMEERKRQSTEYLRQYPKRTKIPKRILNWIPSTHINNYKQYNPKLNLGDLQLKMVKKINLTFHQFSILFQEQYAYSELLEFEKEYLGYYWHSPLGMYHYDSKNNIKGAKKTGTLECVIEESETKKGAHGEYKVLKVTDGIANARVNVWNDVLMDSEEELFESGIGIRMRVKYQEKWRSFSVKSGTMVLPLPLLEEEELVEELAQV